MRALERAMDRISGANGLGVHIVVDDHQPEVNMHTFHHNDGNETRSVRLQIRSHQVHVDIEVRNVDELIEDLKAGREFLRGEDDRS